MKTQTPTPDRIAARRPIEQRGFALLIVLLALGFLALLGIRLVSAARLDSQMAGDLTQEAAEEAAADGAVERAMFALLAAHDPSFLPGAAAQEVRIGRVPVIIAVQNEADRVNLNTASGALLRALLVQVGAQPALADQLSAAILDWRTQGTGARGGGAKLPQYQAAGLTYAPSGDPFRSIDELRDVIGMTPALFTRLQPHVTIFSESDPDMTTRDKVVARALSDATGVADVVASARPTVPTVLRILATAVGSGGARYTLMVVASADFQNAAPHVDILLRQHLATTQASIAMGYGP